MKTIGFSFDLHPPLFMIVFVILCGITCFILKKRKANMTVKQLFFVATTIFYSLSVVKLTLLPITISFDKTSYPHALEILLSVDPVSNHYLCVEARQPFASRGEYCSPSPVADFNRTIEKTQHRLFSNFDCRHFRKFGH